MKLILPSLHPTLLLAFTQNIDLRPLVSAAMLLIFIFLTSLFCLQKTADVGGKHSTTDFLECLKEEIGQMARVGGMQ